MKRVIIQSSEVPVALCLYEYKYVEDTINLINRIDNLCNEHNEFVTVDLRNVRLITAAASLLLFAVTSKSQLIHGKENQVRFIFPTDKNPEGYALIVRTGLARALRAGTEEKLKELIDKENYFQAAITPSEHIVKTVEFLTKNVKLNEIQFEKLTTAINEAMLNVIHHAYKDPLEDNLIHPKKKELVNKIGERWWQCSWYDENDKTWVFIIVDLGLGIPTTYQTKLDNKKLTGMSTSRIMGEAFTEGKSRFDDKEGRGNGSENIKQAINQNIEAENLLVFSGNVKYLHNKSLVKPYITNLNLGFDGTLIEWTLCLRGTNHD